MMMDKEVKRRVDFLSEKYGCVICPIFKTDSLTVVCVLYKDQSMEDFEIVADNKYGFLIELANHFRNKWGR